MLHRHMEGLDRIASLSDSQLVEALAQIARSERQAIAVLVATLAEFDARRLFLGLGYSSLFDYCTRALHLSEQAAYTRIEAARASRRFPIIIDRIAAGGLSLTATRLLAPHLTEANYIELLEQASGKKTRQVEVIVAAIRPSAPVPSTIRKVPKRDIDHRPSVARSESALLPERLIPLPRPAPPSVPAWKRPVISPLSETHYKMQVTISTSAHDKLREAQALMRHSLPNGDPAAIIERALDALLVQLRKTKFAATPKPCPAAPSHGRHIPAAVKREVWERDGGRCAFADADGNRCEETAFLEFHHVQAYARGGPSTGSNIQLRCRAHNAYEAELLFGKP